MKSVFCRWGSMRSFMLVFAMSVLGFSSGALASTGGASYYRNRARWFAHRRGSGLGQLAYQSGFKVRHYLGRRYSYSARAHSG